MDLVKEEVANVSYLIPWVPRDAIEHFIRNVPKNRSQERSAMCLQYFYKQRDKDSENLKREIELDAINIMVVLRDVPYADIKNKLLVFGNIQGRREAVVRALLHEKYNADLNNWNVDGSPNKRKAENEANSQDETIKIKIRRKDGGLEVVSTFDMRRNSTGGNDQVMQQQQPQQQQQQHALPLPFAGSANNMEPRGVTIPSPCFSSPSTSSDSSLATINTTPPRSLTPPAFDSFLKKLRNNNNNNGEREQDEQREGRGYLEVPQLSKGLLYFGSGLLESSSSKRSYSPPYFASGNSEPFNLVTYLQYNTRASGKRIRSVIAMLGLDVKKKPSPSDMETLIKHLNYKKIIHISDTESSSKSATDSDNDHDLRRKYAAGSRRNEALSRKIAPEPSITIKRKAPEATIVREVTEVPQIRPTDVPHLEVPPPVEMEATPMVRRKSPRRRENILEPDPVRRRRSPENLTAVAATNVSEDVPLLEVPPAVKLEPIQEVRRTSPRRENVLDILKPDPVIRRTAVEGLITAAAVTNVLEAGPSTSNHEKVIEWMEAAGPSSSRKRNVDDKLVYRIIEMFPDACPDYIRDLCEDKVFDDLTYLITEHMLATDYPKRMEKPNSPPKEIDPEEQYENLKEILPDADPTYLRRKCDELAGNMEAMKQFIAEAFETRQFPTMKEYLRKQQLSAQQKQYTTEFKVEDFVQLFPDPKAVFNDPNRNVQIDRDARYYLANFMRNKYEMIAAKHVDEAVFHSKDIKTCIKTLDKHMKSGPRLKKGRRKLPLPDTIQNIPLLQELAYYSHQDEIKKYIAEKAKREETEKQEAIANGQIETCRCCFDDEVMPHDIFTCENGCKFCRNCIKRSVEVAMGDGKTTIGCLGECQAEFGLFTLQEVLPPKVFSKLAQKKAVAEVKAAGIEELENCPFCDFATIPAPEDKLFRCLNPDCMKESCRSCKEPNHVPLKCEEVEVDEAVKARTYIENKLTEALLRKCWKCGTKFFKEEGCNKMTCSCGAMMCYLCRQPVTDYKHFNGIGGDQLHLCPLYTDNIAVNEENVLKAAQTAKAEVDVSKLKHDPTVDLQTHFKERKKVVPQPYLEMLNVVQAARVQLQQHQVAMPAADIQRWVRGGQAPHQHYGQVAQLIQRFNARLQIPHRAYVAQPARVDVHGQFPEAAFRDEPYPMHYRR